MSNDIIPLWLETARARFLRPSFPIRLCFKHILLMYSSGHNACDSFSAKKSPNLFFDRTRLLIPNFYTFTNSLFLKPNFHLSTSLRLYYAPINFEIV